MAEVKPDWAIQPQERVEMSLAESEMELKLLGNRVDNILLVISPFLGTTVCVTAGEVLKRAAGGVAQKQSHHRRGRQFYGFSHAKLELACMAYTGQDLVPDWTSLDVLKKYFQEILLAKNRAVRGIHAQTVEDLTKVEKLTEAVEHCLFAFEKLPKLKTEYPKQWIVVKQFETFKKLLPDEFCVKKT